MATAFSPFKFLDAYTREDREIFFGRDREIEDIYQKVFESKILLVYGISGTGKTSLINCGLANKFAESDWLPINIRRGKDINESLISEIKKASITDLKKGLTILNTIQSVYLDHFKPIYLIFDQFEELFIFGERQERDVFMHTIGEIVKSDLQCKCLFSIREEYLAGVTEFESSIPDFLANRIRIEKMTHQNAREVIEGPCEVNGIKVGDGFTDSLLHKLNPNSNEIELTYLQVFLDKIFKLSGDHKEFSRAQIEQVGDVSDLLGSFLEEQIGELEDPDTGLVVLKAFVSTQGTKKQIGEEEIRDFANTLGKPLESKKVTDLLVRFVNLRVLKDKDDHNQYELRHDSLAVKIYEKITLVEKELLEIKDFLDNSFNNFERRGIYLNEADLKYIAPYEDKLFLSKKLQSLISVSKGALVKAQRRKRRLIAVVAICMIAVLSFFTGWAILERGNAIDQSKLAEAQRQEAIEAGLDAEKSREIAEENEKIALLSKKEAEESKEEAIHARDIATKELYENIRSSFTISTIAMNVLYRGLNNPISISASGIKKENLLVSIDNGSIDFDETKNNGYARPGGSRKATISLSGITNFGDTLYLGAMDFRVLDLPKPTASIAGLKGGAISMSDLINAKGVDAAADDFLFEVDFVVTEFSLVIVYGGIYSSRFSDSNRFTQEQIQMLRLFRPGQKLTIDDIKAIGPDGRLRTLNSITFEILDLSEPEIQALIEDPEAITNIEQLIAVLQKLENEERWRRYSEIVSDHYKILENDFESLNSALWNMYLHGDRYFLFRAQEAAIDLVQKSNRKPDYIHTLAALTYKLGEIEKALELEKEAIVLADEKGGDTEHFQTLVVEMSDPENPQNYLFRGLRMEREPGLDEQAMEMYRKAVIIDPEYAPGWYQLGSMHDRFSNDEGFSRDSAMYFYAKAIESDPGFEDAVISMVYKYDRSQTDEKIDLLNGFLEVEPSSKSGWRLIHPLYIEAQELEKSLDAARNYLELDSVNVFGYTMLSESYIYLQDYEASIHSARKGLSLGTENGNAEAFLVIAYALNGEFAKSDAIIRLKKFDIQSKQRLSMNLIEILDELENNQITHPDFEKIRTLINE
ncbi:MAG: GldM family protein [Bacteroidota bacterium]